MTVGGLVVLTAIVVTFQTGVAKLYCLLKIMTSDKSIFLQCALKLQAEMRKVTFHENGGKGIHKKKS